MQRLKLQAVSQDPQGIWIRSPQAAVTLKRHTLVLWKLHKYCLEQNRPVTACNQQGRTRLGPLWELCLLSPARHLGDEGYVDLISTYLLGLHE